jgi:hypothetical protein
MKIFVSFIIVISIILSLSGDPPDWHVISGTQYSMIVLAEIVYNDIALTNTNGNIAAAFGPGGDTDCRSIGYWQIPNPPYHNGFWYFTIVGNEPASQNLPIHFKFYQAAEDDIYFCLETVEFANNTTIGHPTSLFTLNVQLVEYGYVTGTVNLYGAGLIEDVIVQTGSYSTQPNINGVYYLSALPGIYTVTASIAGYFSQSIQNVIVVSGQTSTNVNFTLYPNQSLALLLPTTASGTPSSNTVVPLHLNNPNNIGVEGVMLEMEFDTTILSLQNISFENTLLESFNYQIQQNVENNVLYLWLYSTSALFSGSGVILNFNFLVLPNAVEGSQTTIMISQATVNEIEAIGNSCNFSIINYYGINGTINYFSSQLPIANAVVMIVGNESNSISTNLNGQYQLLSNPSGNYFSTVSKSGDLGGLSSLDASRIARFGVGLYELNCYQQIAADVTLNGEITATDASRVARYVVGLLNSLNTSNKHWVFSTGDALNCTNWPPIQYSANYQYQPLQSDLWNQDYTGIRLGDVTGNWNSVRQENGRNVFVSLPNIEAEQGSQVSVPIYIENAEDMEAIDIKIQYDSVILQAVSGNLNASVLQNSFAYQINVSQPGIVTISLYSISVPYSGNGNIFNLVFQVSGEVGQVSDLAFIELNINEADYLANTTNGGITVLASNTGEQVLILQKSALLGNYPNPFNPETAIHFYLEKTSKVTLSIFNVKGQLIRTILQNELETGYHSINWNGKDGKQKELPSGIYFYQIKTENFSEIKKALLIK